MSKHLAKLMLAAGAVVVAMALVAPAAGAATLKGYERFEGCPSQAENSEVFLCQRAVIDGGHFKMGNKDVPITKPIILSGGVTFTGEIAANSKGGIAPVKQTVPGGLVGLTGLDWLVDFLSLEALKLYAVTEIAGVPHFAAEGEGFRTELPIRVHLENPALGSKCYVGSFTNPIKLNLTTGTTAPPGPNKPISGTIPTEGTSDLANVGLFENGVFVDNSFAAPGANGCELNLGLIHIGIDSIVNLASGLPAAAGTNETKQNFDLEVATPETVYGP